MPDQSEENLKTIKQLEEEISQLKEQQAFSQQKYIEFQSKSADISASLIDDLKSHLGVRDSIGKADQNILKLNQQINTQILNQKYGANDIKGLKKDIAKNEDLIIKAKTQEASLQGKMTSKDKTRLTYLKGRFTALNNAHGQIDKINAAKLAGQSYDKEALKAAKDKVARMEQQIGTASQNLTHSAKSYMMTKAQREELEKVNSGSKLRLDKEQKIEKSMGISGTILGGMAKVFKDIPGAAKVFGDATEKTKEEIRAIADKTGKVPGKFKAGAIAAKNLGKVLIDAVTSPMAIIGFLVKGMFDLNKATVSMQKSMGLSAAEAEDYKGEIITAAAASGDAAISHQKMLKSMSALNDISGVSNKRSMATLETFTKLTAKIGLSGEEAFKLERFSKLTGANFEKQRKETAAAGVNLAGHKGIYLDGKKILQGVANVTGQVAANLGNNPIAIGEAVAQAQMLGTTLQKVADIGKSLLDFEGSIEKEMEAELLIGKDLNLERARALALAGDQKGLAEELADQVGSLSEWTDMNVIQQQKMAQAFGMSADEMSDMLAQQEYQLETAEEARELGLEDLAQRMEARTLQEAMADMVEKIQTVIIQIAEGPLGTIAGWFSSMLQSTTGMYAVLGLMAVLLAGKIVIGLKNAVRAARMLKLQEMGSAVAKAWQAAMSAGPLSFFGGLAMGAIMTGAIIAAVSAFGDDVFSPGQGKSGYGSRTLFGPEGAIALNNKDTVIAGTNLFDKGNDVVSTGAGTINIPPTPAINIPPTPAPSPPPPPAPAFTPKDMFNAVVAGNEASPPGSLDLFPSTENIALHTVVSPGVA